jgi:hypothetical protein
LCRNCENNAEKPGFRIARVHGVDVYPHATMEAVRALGDIGMSPSWIARELQIPRRTGLAAPPAPPRPLAPEPYAYLLGLYLGDGHVSKGGAHGQQRLAIACDTRYPGIIDSARQAMAAIVPGTSVWLVHHRIDNCVRVTSCSRWWPILLPQHGPGRKHARPIVLTTWQRAITGAHPQDLIRGLIHSDGSRFVANQRVGGKTYSYARYAFSNRSTHILGIFCEHLDLLGIGWTRPNAVSIAIDRRAEVAKLDAFVGPKC